MKGTTISTGVLVLSILGMLVVFALALAYDPYLNHDVAYFLTGGQMLIHGARPYVEIIDTNLPMVLYLSALPAAFSQLSGVTLAASGNLFVLCLVLGTMLLWGSVLQHIVTDLSPHERYFSYAAWLFVSLWVYSHGSFGQRDHLIVLFLAPFLLVRYGRYLQAPIPPALALGTSFLGFLAVAMKPFFVLPVVVVELACARQHRRSPRPLLAPEASLWGGLGVLYLVHFYLVPGMSAFYDYWLGVILRGYPGYASWPRGALVATLLEHQAFMRIPLILTVALCLLLLRRRQAQIVFAAGLFGLFSVCSLLLYIWQAKSFGYHLIPVVLCSFLGGSLLCIHAERYLSTRIRRTVPMLAIVALGLAAYAYPLPVALVAGGFERAPFSYPESRVVQLIDRFTEPDERVLFIGLRTNDIYPALTYSGRMQGGRFLCTFPLYFCFRDSTDYVPMDGWKGVEAVVYRMLTEDVQTMRPRMVFVDSRIFGLSFQATEYLRRKRFFERFPSYRLMGRVDGFDVYLAPGRSPGR